MGAWSRVEGEGGDGGVQTILCSQIVWVDRCGLISRCLTELNMEADRQNKGNVLHLSKF